MSSHGQRSHCRCPCCTDMLGVGKRNGRRSKIDDLIARLAACLSARQQMLAVAESCTGGLLAAACTERPGSSDWVDRGFVTYSNAAKQEMLGVNARLIERHGAVSAAVVGAMLAGTLAYTRANWAIAIRGVAGPGGGSREKPVGTVYIGWAERMGQQSTRRFALVGDRQMVRQVSVTTAIEELVAGLA